MLKTKAKRKRTPRRRSLRILVIVATLLLCAGLARNHINTWLKNDPFTPMCRVDNLELLYTSGAKEDEIFIYRMRANGERPSQVSDLTDSHATSMKWSPDGEMIVFSMPNTSPSNLHFVSTETGETTIVGFQPTDYFDWYFMPDNSAIILRIRSDGNREGGYSYIDNFYQINLPLSDTPMVEPINGVPSALATMNYHGSMLGSQSHKIAFDAMHTPQIIYLWNPEQYIYSPDGKYVAATHRIRQRVGVNKRQRIFIYDAINNAVLWEIEDDTTEYDVEYLIQSISPSNELLYFRRYYPIGENNIAAGTPYEVFIAHIDEGRIEPILEDRPLNLIRSLTWSPDGKWMHIALENWQTRTIESYLADHDGTNQTHINSLEFNHYSIGKFDWTPDGDHLSYIASNGWIYLLDLETRQRCRFAKGRTDGWSTNYDWRLIP